MPKPHLDQTTLEGRVLGFFQECTNELTSLMAAEGFSKQGFALGMSGSVLNKRYNEIPANQYETLIELADELIDILQSGINYGSESFKKAEKEYNSFLAAEESVLIRKMIRVGMKYSSGDTKKDFIRKNSISKSFDKEMISLNYSMCVEYFEAIDNFSLAKQKTFELRNRLGILSKKLDYVKKVLRISKSLKQENLFFNPEYVDARLIGALDGQISLSRALKDVRYKPPKPTIKLTETKTSAIIPVIKKEPLSYQQRQYDSNNLKFLTERGFKVRRAKDFLERDDFGELKIFMQELETTFVEAGIPKKEVFTLYHGETRRILRFDKGKQEAYLQAVEDLLQEYQGISGYSPTVQKELYTSSQAIRTAMKSSSSNVIITGLDLVTFGKDSRQLEERLKSSVFSTGTHIKKYVGGNLSYMHEACTILVGHDGYFRRDSFGERRVLFEVINQGDEKHQVDIFAYFTSLHDFKSFFER